MTDPQYTAVVGLDTASNRWHAVAASPVSAGACAFDTARCLAPKKEKNPDIKRQLLWSSARDYFKTCPAGTWIFTEEPMALQNGKTTRLLGMAAGAIWAAAQEVNCFWYWVNVAEWKSGIGLKASAKKVEVEDYVKARLEINPAVYADWEEDHFDAFCIREWGEKKLLAGNLL